MKWESFIRRLRSELPQHTSEVDADLIWKSIEPAVDQINRRETRRRWLLGWMGLAGLLLIGGSVYFSVMKSNDLSTAEAILQNNKTELEANLQENRSAKAAATTTTEKLLANPSIADQSSVDSEDSKATNQDISNNSTSGSIQVANNDVLKSKLNKGNAGSGGDKIIPNSKTQNGVSSRQDQASKRAIRKRETSSGNPQMSQEANTSNLSSSNQIAISAEHVQTTHPSASEISNGMRSAVSERGEYQATASINSQSSLRLANYSNINQSLSSLASQQFKLKTNPKTDCPRFSKVGLSYLLGVHGGASYPFKKFSSTGSGEELLSLRDSTETSLVSGNFGIDFMLRHKSGFEVLIGLQLSTLMERFDLERTVTTTEFEYGIQAISINPLGDTTYIMGDIPVTTTKRERKRYYNKYSFVEIPFYVGYSKQIKNLRVGGEVGIVAGFLTKTEGKIMDLNREFDDLDGDNGAVSGSKFGLSYYFGATVAYVYESGFELAFSPNVRYAPSDFGSADYPVRKKYILVGGNIAVRYRFGGK